MHAAVIEEYGAPLVVRDVPDPELGPDDVLVRVEAAGVCATDLKVIEGGIMADPSRLPMIPGHEIAGSISALGDRVTGMNVGDRVAVHALYSCGNCDYCAAGEEEACPTGIPNLAGVGVDGGYAEYAKVPADHVLPLPDGMSPADAARCSVPGLPATPRSRTPTSSPASVSPSSASAASATSRSLSRRAMGAEVIAVTSSPEKADVARQLGARDVTDADGAAALLQGHGRRPRRAQHRRRPGTGDEDRPRPAQAGHARARHHELRRPSTGPGAAAHGAPDARRRQLPRLPPGPPRTPRPGRASTTSSPTPSSTASPRSTPPSNASATTRSATGRCSRRDGRGCNGSRGVSA
ncbi:MAG: alcohol dehydrogenase catalytic domain-containing protein [Dehalococcoidia bacterium]|nr:alcohol dehydrogenase catalytic domain-containing protein [Dehalococcoidia bacterium]